MGKLVKSCNINVTVNFENQEILKIPDSSVNIKNS